ncbi:hypothetical protein BDQ12DRAFT_668158 [Crucibulum laeve]|uniref:Uncharacterized protein n=1 Tax=Crucibulum laeve TaxID=68775 RepID=A0A5C3LSB2_9AGAR|nr:hypothetical protein BDQ12DRAFT_668158 [Crucibulum laeve]
MNIGSQLSANIINGNATNTPSTISMIIASTTAANMLLNALCSHFPLVSSGPCQPWEVVLPTPLAGALLSGEMVLRLDAIAQEMKTPQKTPLQSVQPPPRLTTMPLQQYVLLSPQITSMNPVLLMPDIPNSPPALPQELVS